MKQTRRTLLAGMLLSAFALAGCGQKAAESAPPSSAPQAEASSAGGDVKEYVVGTDASYAPFEFQTDKGEIVGFDVEVLTAVAAKGGFKVKFVNTPWEGIFATLDQGDRDILASSITITDERKKP